MNLMIRNGRVIDPSQQLDEVRDIFVRDGVICASESTDALKNDNVEDVRVVDAKGMWVVPGLIDLHVHLRDPGLTHKETIATGARAAAAGGFTTICAMPNTKPVTDTKETVAYVLEENRKAPYTHVLPIGAITMGQAGKELTDQEALMAAGACAISEDGQSVADASLMEEAMKLSKKTGMLIMDHCEDAKAAKSGDSRAAENLMTEREVRLAEKTGIHLHVCHVSTKESAEIVREAKERIARGEAAEGAKVTAEVCPHHFVLDDRCLEGGDPNFKMNPPLRAVEDVEAMKQALKDGTIECISTDHAPHTAEDKKRPIEKAANGIIGMETAFSLASTYLLDSVLTPSELIACMATNPGNVLGDGRGTLKEGRPADIVIIDPNEEYTVDVSTFYSKARNCPYDGMKLKGRVKMTILDGRVVYENGRVIEVNA